MSSILWPEWEEVSSKERREEGGGVQGDGAGSFVLCELCLLSLFTHIFFKTLSDLTCGNYVFLKTCHVTCWSRCHPDQTAELKLIKQRR